MIRLLAVIALSLVFFAAPACAQDKPALDKKPKLDMNVSIPPQVEIGRAAYAAAKAKLTPEQGAAIDKIIEETKKEYTRIWADRILGLSTANACGGTQPPEQLNDLRREMFIADRYVQSVMLGARYDLGRRIAALKTMPPQTAIEFFDAEMAFMGAVSKSLAEVANKMKPPAKSCADGKAIIAGLFTPGIAAAQEVADRSSAASVQDHNTNRLQACIIGGGAAETADGAITTSFVFGATEENGRMVARPTYSLKMMKKDGTYAYLKEAYLDFGGINTRDIGVGEKAGEQMFIGLTNTSVLPAIMGRLRTHPFGFGVTDMHTGKTYDMRITRIASENLQKFVDCAANLEPKLAADFKMAGFTPRIDKSIQSAVSAPPGPRAVYSVMPISGDIEAPAACVITTLQGQRVDGYDLGVSLLLYDRNPKVPESPLAEIWVMGTQMPEGRRIEVTDADITVTGADGKLLSSRSLQDRALPGQRYTVKMTSASGTALYEGMVKNGLQATITPAGGKPVKLSFPPVEASVAAVYKTCLSNLSYNRDAR